MAFIGGKGKARLWLICSYEHMHAACSFLKEKDLGRKVCANIAVKQVV